MMSMQFSVQGSYAFGGYSPSYSAYDFNNELFDQKKYSSPKNSNVPLEGIYASTGSTPPNIEAAALLLANLDGPWPYGDILGAALIAGSVAYDVTTKTYVTYTLKNPVSGQLYVGRASGHGDAFSVMMQRFSSHHMRPHGFTNPTLDVQSFGYPLGYYQIRGREQMLVDHYGGIGSPLLANSINPIWIHNPNRPAYMLAAYERFGPVIK